MVIHNDRFIGQGAYTAEKRVSCQVLLWPDLIWYGHDVPDHSKCRSSMLNLLQQLEKEGVGGRGSPTSATACVLQSLLRDRQRRLAWPSRVAL